MTRHSVDEYAKIRVVGVGGGGSNAVDRMIESGLMGVEYLAVNTDAQVLDLSAADRKLQIGGELTRGLGTGGNPDMGRQSAEESRQDIMMALDGADMIFVTAGMGGGTGTGASAVIAEIARELGALTIAVVTKPFTVEGHRRAALAAEGIARLKEHVDTLIVIPNDRLVEMSDQSLSLTEAFALADTVLQQGVRGISEVIVVPGLINLDFADVRAVLKDAGTAMMGIGEATGEGRAQAAAQAAISSPLLEVDINGARSVLFNITGGPDLTLSEVHQACQIVQEAASAEGHDVDLTLGAVSDPKMEGQVRITVLATGFDEALGERRRARSETAARPEPARAATAAAAATPPTAEKAAFAQEMPTYDEDDIDIPAFLRRR